MATRNTSSSPPGKTPGARRFSIVTDQPLIPFVKEGGSFTKLSDGADSTAGMTERGAPNSGGLPRLELDGIEEPGKSSSRMSSAITNLDESDNRASLTIVVVPDPDAVLEPTDDTQDMDRNGEAAEGAAKAPASDSPAQAEAAAPASDPALGDDGKNTDASNVDMKEVKSPGGTLRKSASTKSPTKMSKQAAAKKQQMNRFYQKKDIMSPEKAAALAHKLGIGSKFVGGSRAAQEREEKRRESLEKHDERVRRRMAVRIQKRERARQAMRLVRELRLQAWALDVVLRGLLAWRDRIRAKAAAEAARKEKERLEREQRMREREATEKQLAEEAERRKYEEESKSPGAARRRAKNRGIKEKEEQEQKLKKQRERAAAAAQEAMKIAQVEAEKERAFWEDKAARKANEHEEKQRLEQEAKLQKDREKDRQDQLAREEAQAVVRGFAEALQELAMTGTEQSEDIRRAGGIPPLVAMLNSNTAPHIEMAAAMALTHVSQASEVNRVAIRKANGFQPLIALAAQSQRNGTMKYTAAITSLAIGTNGENQDAIREAGGIPLLVGLLPNGPDSKTTCDAIAALRHLTYGNTPNCNSLREASGIHWIVSLLQAGPDRLAASDAAATLYQMAVDNPPNQDAIREAGGIRPLISLLTGTPESEALKWGLKCLATIARDNTTNRTVICEQQGTITRLVAILGEGARATKDLEDESDSTRVTESAKLAAEVLRTLMLGNDDRVALAVLAALRRQGVGLGEKAVFNLSDLFPSLLEGLAYVVGARLAAAVKQGSERGKIQMALNDAIALELPEEQLDAARARLESIAAARAEAIAARKARGQRGREKKAKEEEEKRSRAELSRQNSTMSAHDHDKPVMSSEYTGAMAQLAEAQQRLKDLELAAMEARRARMEAARQRQSSGIILAPQERLKMNQKTLSAADRVAKAAEDAAQRASHDELDDELDADLKPSSPELQEPTIT